MLQDCGGHPNLFSGSFHHGSDYNPSSYIESSIVGALYMNRFKAEPWVFSVSVNGFLDQLMAFEIIYIYLHTYYIYIHPYYAYIYIYKYLFNILIYTQYTNVFT